MNPLRRTLAMAALALMGCGIAAAQPTWFYRGAIGFPVEDSVFARPLLCATDAAGNLWVISSNNVDANAHNALYKVAPGASVMTRMVDYTANLDPQVKSTRGIATLGNDVYVAHHRPDAGTTVSAIMVYRGGDTTKRETYGFGLGQSGYGTFIFGLAITKDTILVGGISFGTSVRMWNYNRTVGVAGFGSYIPPPSNTLEPGGPNTAGIDIIRDVATLKTGNYHLPTTVFYSSRNSSVDAPTTGGIALWIGGTDTTPVNYRSKRVSDFFSDLALGSSLPYGITLDATGNLYVCGTDTLRRWVRGYAVDTSGNATSWAEFPSSTDVSNPNPVGAPFQAPSDVAFSPDYTRAYVIDAFARKVFWFATTPAGVGGGSVLVPTEVSLGQNYPNPFNPFTTIQVNMPATQHASLRVYSVLGRPVATLVDQELTAGQHFIAFDAAGRQLTSGVYYYRLTTGDLSIARKMVLSK